MVFEEHPFAGNLGLNPRNVFPGLASPANFCHPLRGFQGGKQQTGVLSMSPARDARREPRMWVLRLRGPAKALTVGKDNVESNDPSREL